MPYTSRLSNRTQAGFTIIEVAIVLAIAGVLASLAVPMSARWMDGQRLRSSVQRADAALSYARGEAIRTGRLHIVFFETDAAGSSLTDDGGDDVDILVIDDGRPGATNQNCQIDSGERVLGLTFEQDVSFGTAAANSTAPADGGGGDMDTGSTFTDAGGSQASWVLFRPEGVPLAFSSDCTVGVFGSGGGGIYLSGNDRDISVVLSPLGMPHVHSWARGSGTWSK